MNIGVIGHTGHVGRALIDRGAIPIPCDITNITSLSKAITSEYDVIALLASKSDVDFCEDQRNMDIVLRTNLHGPLKVFEHTEKAGVPLIFLSSDHVFSGWSLFKSGGYKESDDFAPRNYYGLVKACAEGLAKDFTNVRIVRTSTLFERGMGRIDDPIRMMQEGQTLDFPTFIFRSFMYVHHFAEAFMQYLQRVSEMPKILHISGSSIVSWYEFMSDLASDYHIEQRQVQKRSKDKKQAGGKIFAPRPPKAGLDVSQSRTLDLPQYSYLEGLTQMRKNEP